MRKLTLVRHDSRPWGFVIIAAVMMTLLHAGRMAGGKPLTPFPAVRPFLSSVHSLEVFCEQGWGYRFSGACRLGSGC
jgi:hypothetical protein